MGLKYLLNGKEEQVTVLGGATRCFLGEGEYICDFMWDFL